MTRTLWKSGEWCKGECFSAVFCHLHKRAYVRHMIPMLVPLRYLFFFISLPLVLIECFPVLTPLPTCLPTYRPSIHLSCPSSLVSRKAFGAEILLSLVTLPYFTTCLLPSQASCIITTFYSLLLIPSVIY